MCCLPALDASLELRASIPRGELGAIAHNDVGAQRDERRLGNRLRADLPATFAAAMDIADGDLGDRLAARGAAGIGEHRHSPCAPWATAGSRCCGSACA
ncbi:hypothetical protein [Actinomadura sediminis]|uniref:Uncharacterized protein n=1 Tax=Actinomadura sediminis TaxID=1038904 RepID=A0ABW3EKR1_9ACTN